jgi:hypothetical protein
VLVDKLRKPQCTRQPSRPAANDDDIGRHLRAGYVCGRFAENKHQNFATDFRGLNRIKHFSERVQARNIRG